MRTEFVVQPKRLLLPLLAGLALMAFGACLLTSSSRSDKAAGIFNVVFGSVCCVWVVRQMQDRQPQLILDETGIFDRRLATPIIPWRSIGSARILGVGRGQFIVLSLDDEHERVS